MHASSIPLTRLDEGQFFVPTLLRQSSHRWFPADLIYSLPGHGSEWQKSL